MTKRGVRFILYMLLLGLDTLSILFGYLIGSQIDGMGHSDPHRVQLGIMLTVIYSLLAINKEAYTVVCLEDQAESMRRSLSAFVMTVLIVLTVAFYLQAGIITSRITFAAGMVGAGLGLAAARAFFHRYAAARYPEGFTDVLLILDGTRPSNVSARHTVSAQHEGIEPNLRDPVMLSRLAYCLQGFDRAIVACPMERQHSWSLLLKGANIRGEILLEDQDTIGAISLGRFSGTDTLVVSRGPLSMANRAKKRALDLAITVPILIFIAPLLAIIALLIKLDSPGPVFFQQQRVGRSNQLFNILKFRSMHNELCDADGNVSTQRDDERITRVGSFIRKTSIDELPQLINVLRGDMSLVGPRPHALGSLAADRLFWEVNEKYWIRHALKPGITGLAQIRGYRGATPKREDLERRLSSDLEYVNNWRLWRDISILFATFKVLVHRNAY